MEYQYWIVEENKYVHVLKYFEDMLGTSPAVRAK